MQDFNYLVGQQLSDVNRRTGATEVWVVKDIRVVSNCLVARRQRVENRRTHGPWLGPFHVRDIAVNHWLSTVRGEAFLAFAPQEVNLKKLGKGPLKQSALEVQVTSERNVTDTKRHLPSPHYHPFLRLDIRPGGMRRLRLH